MDRASLTRFGVSVVVLAGAGWLVGRRSRERVQVGSSAAAEPTALGPLSRCVAKLPAATVLIPEELVGQASATPLCRSVPNVIGSDLHCCNIVIRDRHISRRHAQVVYEETGFVIYDLGSADGTYVNGRCVGIHQLQDGDRVQLGATTLAFATHIWYEDGRQCDEDSRKVQASYA